MVLKWSLWACFGKEESKGLHLNASDIHDASGPGGVLCRLQSTNELQRSSTELVLSSVCASDEPSNLRQDSYGSDESAQRHAAGYSSLAVDLDLPASPTSPLRQAAADLQRQALRELSINTFLLSTTSNAGAPHKQALSDKWLGPHPASEPALPAAPCTQHCKAGCRCRDATSTPVMPAQLSTFPILAHISLTPCHAAAAPVPHAANSIDMGSCPTTSPNAHQGSSLRQPIPLGSFSSPSDHQQNRSPSQPMTVFSGFLQAQATSHGIRRLKQRRSSLLSSNSKDYPSTETPRIAGAEVAARDEQPSAGSQEHTSKHGSVAHGRHERDIAEAASSPPMVAARTRSCLSVSSRNKQQQQQQQQHEAPRLAQPAFLARLASAAECGQKKALDGSTPRGGEQNWAPLTATDWVSGSQQGSAQADGVRGSCCQLPFLLNEGTSMPNHSDVHRAASRAQCSVCRAQTLRLSDARRNGELLTAVQQLSANCSCRTMQAMTSSCLLSRSPSQQQSVMFSMLPDGSWMPSSSQTPISALLGPLPAASPDGRLPGCPASPPQSSLLSCLDGLQLQLQFNLDSHQDPRGVHSSQASPHALNQHHLPTFSQTGDGADAAPHTWQRSRTQLRFSPNPSSMSHSSSLGLLHFPQQPPEPLASVPVQPLAAVAEQLSGLAWLGAGADGAVYRTCWRGVPAAVKFSVHSSAQHLQRGAQEAALSRAISHPYLVQTYLSCVVLLAPHDFAAPERRQSSGLSCRFPSAPSSQALFSPCSQGGGAHGRRAVCMPPSLEGGRGEGARGEGGRRTSLAGEGGCPSAELQQLLQQLKAQPGMFLSCIVMEWADKESLEESIQRGVFNTAPLSPSSSPRALTLTSLPSPNSPLTPHGQPPSPFPSPSHRPSCVVTRPSSQALDSLPSTQLLPLPPPTPTTPSSRQSALAWKEEDPSPRTSMPRPSALILQTAFPPASSANPSLTPLPALPCQPPPHPPPPPWHSPTPHPPPLLCPPSPSPPVSTGTLPPGPGSPAAAHLPLPSLSRQGTGGGGGPGPGVVVDRDGGSLEAHSRRAGAGRRDPQQALRALLRTLKEVALGLHYLHYDGIVHGDLKPQNVLLKTSRTDRRGFTAKVADFGVARLTCGQASPASALNLAQVAGTPAYMAPEVMGGQLMKASDVWSFGMLMYHMVAGEAPFLSMHHAQIIFHVQAGRVDLDWPAFTHPQLLRLATACLDMEPVKRPSFYEIAEALSAIEVQLRGEAPRRLQPEHSM